jgi:cell division septation protein DedD
MAENELNGFDNLDNLFGEEKPGGEAAAAAAGGGLDDILGDAAAAAAAGGDAPAAAGGSDSELDSFFEDLSTIDDLEVSQQEAPPAAAAAPKAEAKAEAAEEAPRPRKAAPPKAKKKGGGGLMKRLLIIVVLLAIAGGAAWWFLFPGEQIPWEVTEPEVTEAPAKKEQAPPPPPKPRVAQPAAPKPAAAPPPPAKAPTPRPAPVPETPGAYSIQVGTCFFPSCVEEFKTRLKANKLSSRVREKSQSRETLEIYSSTTFSSREAANAMAERINKENRMEGQAYVFQDGKGFKISLGKFTDLGRANIVKDALNQRVGGEAAFATRVQGIPYKLHYVQGGSYGSRGSAEAALKKLVAADGRFKDAFVIKN